LNLYESSFNDGHPQVQTHPLCRSYLHRGRSRLRMRGLSYDADRAGHSASSRDLQNYQIVNVYYLVIFNPESDSDESAPDSGKDETIQRRQNRKNSKFY
jgi:hypothetical protein